MITSFKIDKCMGLGTYALERAFARNGYSMTSFKDSKFLGITNAGQFCYEVLFFDEGGLEEDVFAKVFVDLNYNDEPVGEW